MPTDSPLPGSLTVPPLHGWVGLVVLLVLAVLVGVGFLVARSLSDDEIDAAEWQSWLEARSRSGAGSEDQAPEPVPHHLVG
ncbi:hypothetical protein [Candidatus Blastococcus massiliensis]|uniref:hypothetical protein n=1 Tax=Candidatus Blastococcus massiliensis TaxID=1470358 RepID=UPI0012DC6109|nr:hypothetical protein [Candidatus Blastococcus massiliensis]